MKTVASPSSRQPLPGPRETLRRAWAFSTPLTFAGVAMLLTLLVTLLVTLADSLTFGALFGLEALAGGVSLVVVLRAWRKKEG